MVTLAPKGTLAKVRFYLLYSCAILVAQLIGYTTFYGVTSASVLWPCAGVFGASLVISHRKHWIAMTLIMMLIDQSMYLLLRESYPGRLGRFTMGVKLVYNPTIGVVFALIVQKYVPERRPLGSLRALAIYILIAVFANMLIFALLCWSVVGLFIEELNVITRWQQWSYSGISGMLAYATPIIVIANRLDERLELIPRPWEAICYGLVFTGTSVYLFAYQRGELLLQPYQFVVLLPLFAWVISRFGPVLLTVSACVLMTIIMVGMSFGKGPFHVDGRAAETDVLVAQGVMVPGMLTLLFITALLESIRMQYAKQIETEKHLRRVDRIQSLGTMASGVAHDFGNLAIALRAYQSILRSNMKNESERVREAIMGIEEIADGAQSLTGALMTFARDETREIEDEPKFSELCDSVRAAVTSINPIYKERYEIVVRLPEDPLWVGISKNDLRRMLGNLIINSFDASEPGQHIVVKVFRKEHQARLIIADHGSGIPEEVMNRIFDPFFTTKPRGKGTGLGLAVVSGLVRDADGELDIDSTPGVGTSITITLPLVPEPEGD
jgi:signal transduction histidine kinase